MAYDEFRKKINLTKEGIYREIFLQNRSSIQVKKENTAINNLEKIFSATIRLSNQKGFQAMSMRDLSRETKLSAGALYHYFSGKDELLSMIQSHRRAIGKRILDECIEKESDPRSRLHAVVNVHLYLSEAMQPWFYFSYMESKNLPESEKKLAVDSSLYTEQLLTDILEEGRNRHDFQVDDCRMTACIIKALLQDWYLKHSMYKKRKTSVDEYASFVLRFVDSFIIAPGNSCHLCSGE